MLKISKFFKIILFHTKNSFNLNANVFYDDGTTEFIPFLHYSETEKDLILIFRQEDKPHYYFDISSFTRQEKGKKIYYIKNKHGK